MAHNLTESSTFTAAIEVPDDGDFVQEVSVEPGFQALANRTKFLKDASDARVVGPASATDNRVARFDGTTGKIIQDGSPVTISDAGAVTGVTSLAMGGALSGVTSLAASTATVGTVSAGAVSNTGEYTYNIGIPRTLYLRQSDLSPPSGGGWIVRGSNGGMALCSTNSGVLMAEFPRLPEGAIITAIKAGVNPGAARAGANRMFVRPVTFAPNASTGALVVSFVYGSEGDNTTTNEQVVTVSSITATPYTVIAGEWLGITVTAGNDAGANNDTLNWISITYTDPGLRNPAG